VMSIVRQRGRARHDDGSQRQYGWNGQAFHGDTPPFSNSFRMEREMAVIVQKKREAANKAHRLSVTGSAIHNQGALMEIKCHLCEPLVARTIISPSRSWSR
jgi:hypothetical protein